MRRAAAVLAVVAACGGGARYLGAPLPPSCTRSVGACEADLQLRGSLDRFPPRDEALRAYAARVAARIARVSTLARTPPILLFPEGSAAVVGTTIVLGRAQLVRLGSEAELAAVLAHEIAHLESGLPALDRRVSIDDATMRVLEGAADERATLLLARAGYPPAALARALGVLEDDPMDRRHPRRDVRQRRLSLLADPRAPGDDGRARFLAAIAGVPAGGRDEHRVGAAYVFARAGLAVEPPAGVRGDGWSQEGGLGAGALRYWTYALGARAGEELAARLRDRHALRVAAGEVLVGRTPAELQGVLSSRDQLLERLRREQWSLPAHAAIAVFARRGEAVLLVVDGADAVSAVEAWARRVRAPTAAERAAAEPARIVLVPAPRAGTVGELVAACVDPAAARELDAPSRVLAAGELMKCTDRVIAGDAAAK